MLVSSASLAVATTEDSSAASLPSGDGGGAAILDIVMAGGCSFTE